MEKFDGKVVIITGSTSGMGKDTALLFARRGAKVVITGRNEDRAKAVVDQIKAEGGAATYVLADTSDYSSAQKIFDATISAYGTVDVLINNAGIHSVTPFAYSGTSGQRFRKHPDTKPEASGHLAGYIDCKIIAAFRQQILSIFRIHQRPAVS